MDANSRERLQPQMDLDGTGPNLRLPAFIRGKVFYRVNSRQFAVNVIAAFRPFAVLIPRTNQPLWLDLAPSYGWLLASVETRSSRTAEEAKDWK
jgi:hypothetical protein